MIELLLILATFGRFTAAADIDYDIQGNFYVVDRVGAMLVKYSPSGDSLRSVSGFGGGEMQFDEPVAVCARQGNDVYVADMNNHRIQRFNRQLDYITTIHTRDDPDERKRFGYPRDLTVTRQGDLLVVDGENRRIVKLNSTGRVERSFGDQETGPGRLVDPSRVEVDAADNIYVLDGARLLVYNSFGGYTRDISLPENFTPRTISIDRDTLTIADSMRISLYNTATRTRIATYATPAPINGMTLINGVVIGVEEHRAVAYRIDK